ncbi:hypothetical protein [Haloparvum sp. AD34]
MRRNSEVEDCIDLAVDESTDHLHIRKKAIVSSFMGDFERDVNNDCRVINVDLSEWNYDEVMETLRWELQRELSWIGYRISRIKSFGLSAFGAGASGGTEKSPNYSRASKYLENVSEKTDSQLILLINHHGEKPVEGFSWISKLGELPSNTTIVTHGYQRCRREESEQYQVGRLSREQTVEYITDVKEGISEAEAGEIHRVHDGNPTAIEIALENDRLKKPLSGSGLERLWSELYDDKLSAEERDLLHGSAHLIDLHYKDVTMTVEKTRGQCKEILRNLENKGVVSKKKSGLYTADRYVNRYINSQLSESESAKNNRTSFRNYAEKWVNTYESQMEEMESPDFEDPEQDDLFSDRSESSLRNPDLYLAIHHLSNLYTDVGKDEFIEELEGVDAGGTGTFMFGIYAQRFFFEDPHDVIQELSESILGIENNIENELFTGTLDIIFNFDAKEFTRELSSGWSGKINTDELTSENVSDPDKLIGEIQQAFDDGLGENMPSEVKLALANIAGLAYADSRTARIYYNKFGKTAQKYGLYEEPFCNWLDELRELIDILNPETESDGELEEDPLESNLESLNSEIRSRIELEEMLNQNHTEEQREFRRKLERIRSKPDEIVEQYIRCGEEIGETPNSLFPYLWYTIGDNIFSTIVLGEGNREIYGKYNYWVRAREEEEAEKDEDQLVVEMEQVEKAFDKT